MSARFSDDGRHRYQLVRDHGGEQTICFIMLNPSKADSESDDPTVRKCLGFARQLKYRRLVVVNLFSMVATDPMELLAADYDWATGDPDNLRHVVEAARDAELVVAAWGANVALAGRKQPRRRDAQVVEALAEAGVALHCLRTTKTGHPAHPLYLPYDLEPVPWSPS